MKIGDRIVRVIGQEHGVITDIYEWDGKPAAAFRLDSTGEVWSGTIEPALVHENQWHAHVESASRDCDGLYTRDYVMTPNDDEHGEFGPLEFKERVAAGLINWDSPGRVDVESGEDYGRPWSRIRYEQDTEEGYRHTEVTFCNDGCDSDEKSYRDHTAESMGY